MIRSRSLKARAILYTVILQKGKSGDFSDEFLASDERGATQRQLKCKEKADVKSRSVPCQHGSVTFLGFALPGRTTCKPGLNIMLL